jgi:hypothetical protein
MKKHLAGWAKIFLNHASKKDSTSKIYKECIQLNNKKQSKTL